ncbi:DUF3726 domain-containing protein [Pararhizobium sp. YC-54]|uniref:DUF3726 domain-containing protein n=1 Tax=Pararhizobium sp. YC-54 TaxID=2986920 RepID=UPI0021F6BB67|nr:DUF3726 domain-containing protein [Pararhizobium sp. YC-54]MCV9999230.1 DUF3726 domain-containing protein [Pararhizobium sp. YC-54]
MTQITLSFNEVLSSARKAAVGAGLPYGVAEDIGMAAAWLSARGVDGIAATVQALETVDPRGRRNVADAVATRAAVEGVAAIDALCAGETAKTIVLGRVDAPALLAGLAGVAATNLGLAIHMTLPGGQTLFLPYATDLQATIGDGRNIDISLTCRGETGHAPPDEDIPARPHGCDEIAYRTAMQLAARGYVPASESSRAGAGTSKSDND